jgi:hypothetical protein
VRFGSGRFLFAAAEVYLSTAITYAEKGMSIAMSIPATMRSLQPAVVYHRDSGGVLRADGTVVLAPTATGVARVIKFHDPALVAAFGFPDVLAQ